MAVHGTPTLTKPVLTSADARELNQTAFEEMNADDPVKSFEISMFQVALDPLTATLTENGLTSSGKMVGNPLVELSPTNDWRDGKLVGIQAPRLF
jgi:hypothetical protein